MFQLPVLVSPVSPSPGQGMPWEHQGTHQTQIPYCPHTINAVNPQDGLGVWFVCLWVWLANGYQRSALPIRLVIFSQFLLFNKKSPLTSRRKQSQYPCLSLRRSMRNIPRFVHWQWSSNEGIAPCPSAQHVRLILPLSYLSNQMYLALNIKTSKYFKPRGHSSSSFHIFMVD